MKNTNIKLKPEKEEAKKKSTTAKIKKTSDIPQEGIPDVDFKKFLGCG